MIVNSLAWLFGRPSSLGATTPLDPSWFSRYLPLVQSLAGVTVTVDEALQLSVVWACVDAITKAICSSRWDVYAAEVTKDGRRNRRFLPLDPLDWLLNGRPNPEMTAIAVRESLMFSGLTYGNGFAEIVRDMSGRPIELWPLLPDRMMVCRYTSGDRAGELYYQYYNPNGARVELEPRQVFHLRGPSIDGLMGDVIISRAAKAIAVAMASERFASNYFANNTILGVYLEYPGRLDKPTRENLKADWEEKHKGVEKAHNPMILEGGMKVNVPTHNAEQAQLVEARTFSIEEICRFYGVPPHKVQHLSRATFNNIEHLGMEFVRDAITPWALRLEQEADYKLFPINERKPWRHTSINTAWLMQGDAKTRAETHQIYRRSGVLSANDILADLGRNTIKDAEGDALLVEANMTTVEGIEKQVEQIGKVAPAAPAPGTGKGSEPVKKPEDPAEPKGPEAPPKPPTKPAPKELVRDATTAVLASTLAHYARRLRNRAADLERKGKSEFEVRANLAEDRETARSNLLSEAAAGIRVITQLSSAAASDLAVQLTLLADGVEANPDCALAEAARFYDGAVTNAEELVP